MKKSLLLKLWNRLRFPHKPELSSQIVEDAVKQHARHVHAIDPETVQQWQRLRTTLEGEFTRPKTEKIVIRRTLLQPAFVVSIIALVAVGTIWLLQPSLKTFTTTKAQHSTMTLSDGTEVTLNHTSELIVQHSLFERARHVSLNGEALFHVRKNGTPFIITTAVGTVQVLGTQFNVRMRDGMMEVAVVSGSVRMTAQKDGIDSSVVLTKDQIAVCAQNEFPELPKTLPYSSYPGWTQGTITLYHSSFKAACQEIESQFDVVIRIHNLKQRNETITGALDCQNIDRALTTLMQLTGNAYRHEDSSYDIY